MSAVGLPSTAEATAIDGLLDAVADGPSGLIFEGEPGIGKTTLWSHGVELAVARGFHVMSSRPASSESVLAFTCLADLLGTIPPDVLADLPDPQRAAVDRVLLRSSARGATDRRAVAAALLSTVEAVARDRPVLIAIDDLQWVDTASVRALESIARRTTGRVGMLGAVRTSRDTSPVTWLQLPRPERLQRMTLHPLSIRAIHAIIADRLGHTFSRPALRRIFEASGGNPYYALELARAHDDQPGGSERFPRSLAEVVQGRLGRLEPATSDTLLAVACLGSPTVDVVAKTIAATPAELVATLEPLEAQGIVSVDGESIRFDHPLLARGVYARASSAERRAMHRRLADTVEDVELRARHLALAATSPDPDTLRVLDAAAELARKRGAPEASAELVDIAVRLGGHDPQRVVRLAGYHFNSGDTDRAREVLQHVMKELPAGGLRARAKYLLGVVRMFDDSFPEAAELLIEALDEVGDNTGIRVEMLVLLAFAQMNAGADDEAVATAERGERMAESHGVASLLAQSIAMRVLLRFIRGDGLDHRAMASALNLEDTAVSAPIAIRPTAISALLASWHGDVHRAGHILSGMRQRCLDHGEDGELIFVSFHSALPAIWRGDLDAAAAAAMDAADVAPQLNGDVPRYVALITSALLAAFTGRVDDARRDATAAQAAGTRSGATHPAQWPVMVLGFLETSLGRHEAAVDVLGPLLRRLAGHPEGTEIVVAWFLPDAIESLIGVGRIDDARRWSDLLYDNGSRLDRAWMLAAGARGRSMALAAAADYGAALAAAEEAMAHHDRIAMPFDRARTQLLLGQLHRRLRRQESAASILAEARDEFERLGIPLWAQRATAQLARTNVGTRLGRGKLAPSERRVARLAATGMTNREVATALFISPKTVEANLARVYRKLGIRSRAELGTHAAELAE